MTVEVVGTIGTTAGKSGSATASGGGSSTTGTGSGSGSGIGGGDGGAFFLGFFFMAMKAPAPPQPQQQQHNNNSKIHCQSSKAEPEEPDAFEPELFGPAEPDESLPLEPVYKDWEYEDSNDCPEPESPEEAEESHGVTVVVVCTHTGSALQIPAPSQPPFLNWEISSKTFCLAASSAHVADGVMHVIQVAIA